MGWQLVGLFPGNYFDYCNTLEPAQMLVQIDMIYANWIDQKLGISLLFPIILNIFSRMWGFIVWLYMFGSFWIIIFSKRSAVFQGLRSRRWSDPTIHEVIITEETFAEQELLDGGGSPSVFGKSNMASYRNSLWMGETIWQLSTGLGKFQQIMFDYQTLPLWVQVYVQGVFGIWFRRWSIFSGGI